MIKPRHKVEILLQFKIKDIARYDTKKVCFILDKGKYNVRVGNSLYNTKIFGYVELNEDIITEQLKKLFIIIQIFKIINQK